MSSARKTYMARGALLGAMVAALILAGSLLVEVEPDAGMAAAMWSVLFGLPWSLALPIYPWSLLALVLNGALVGLWVALTREDFRD